MRFVAGAVELLSLGFGEPWPSPKNSLILWQPHVHNHRSVLSRDQLLESFHIAFRVKLQPFLPCPIPHSTIIRVNSLSEKCQNRHFEGSKPLPDYPSGVSVVEQTLLEPYHGS